MSIDEDFDLFDPMRKLNKRMGHLLSFNFPDDTLEDLKIKGIREPLVDIVDMRNEIEVIAELPGIDKKDLDINVTEDMITFKAKTESKEEKKKEGYYYRERGYSSFVRSLPLPAEVLPNNTKAEFSNGILTIRLKKKHPEEAKIKGFKVQIR
ncbi:MAG: hypothetical protein COT15_04490 [Candidatus Diapherotrites archaeon CG08_land_8_20_14_0_20_34_12]|nr:MAG: hypothetical protein COT15_04490 [Candidatus Diapherotrites archaeon CG08_land_8_20_14_0_20_34_12]